MLKVRVARIDCNIGTFAEIVYDVYNAIQLTKHHQLRL